jgi:hypothetical protein
MIHGLFKEGNDSATSSQPSTEEDSLSESIDRLDFTSTNSAMSTVYGSTSSDSGSRRSSSKSPTRTRRDSGSSTARTASPSGLHLPSFLHPHKHTASQQSSPGDKGSQKRDDHLARWLTSGNVIYKSVGLGAMDLVVGVEVIKLANLKGAGNHIENFSA